MTDRYELDDLLAQMVGELSALHTFVDGGDKRVSPGPDTRRLPRRAPEEDRHVGSLIEHIYQSDPDYPGQDLAARQTRIAHP